MEEDIDAVEKIAKKIHIPVNKFEIFNRLSSLPEPKAKMKLALKERMRTLAAMYVSLATFIDDDDVDFFTNNRKSRKAKKIFYRVSHEIKKAEIEMRNFRLMQ